MGKKGVLIILAFVLLSGAVWYFLNQAARHPNVILIGLDTTRADHLGAYGYERDTSPRLDAFANDNQLYLHTMTAAPWTPPSFATIFTGLYPSAHHMMPPDGRDLALQNSTRLDDRLTTLPELFKRAGYTTAGITPNPWLKPEFGYNQGFDQYYFRNIAKADEITRGAIKILEGLKQKKQPFFLFAHYMDPHDPYTPPAPFNAMFTGNLKSRAYEAAIQEKINQYDGEIRFMDTQLGILLDYLKTNNLYSDSIIIIFGDHGEQFLEHGHLTHGFMLYDEETHVPLMVRNGKAARKIDYTVSLVDVFPTILDLAGLEVPAQANGLSLANEENLRQRNGVISEIVRKFNQKSITSFEGQKIIKQWPLSDGLVCKNILGGNVVGVYDRNIDPQEKASLNDKALQSVLEQDLNAAYQRATSVALEGEAKTVNFDKDTLEQLKSLGYLK